MKRVAVSSGGSADTARPNWRGGLRFGLVMIGVSLLLLALGFLVAPDSNLLGGLGPLAGVVGAIGQITLLISCGVGLAGWLAQRSRRPRDKP